MPAQCSLQTAWILVLVLAGPAIAGSDPTKDDTAVRPPDDDRLDQFLADWQRKASARTTIEVEFTRDDKLPTWGTLEPQKSGRVVILPTGRALVELVQKDREGKPRDTERFIWTKRELHQLRIDGETRTDFIWPIAEEHRGRLPAILALPFLWHTTPDGLKSRYVVKLLREDAETVILRFTERSLPGVTTSSFDKAYLQLDRTTYIPRRYYLINPLSPIDYRVTKARTDAPVTEDVLQIPEGDDWDVVRMDDAKKAPFPAWTIALARFDFLPVGPSRDR